MAHDPASWHLGTEQHEIMDPETFSKIQEMFGKATGISVATFDSFSLQLCPSSILNPICRRLLDMRETNPEVSQKCLDTHYQGLKEAFETGKENRYTCYLGLESTAIPLRVHDKIVGGISAGRVRMAKLNPRDFEILEKYGLNKEEFLKLGRELEEISPERYRQWINLLATVANSVVQERAQQHEEKKRARRLAFISELSRHVGEDMDALLDFIAHSLPEACELEKCTIFLLDEKKGELVAKASNSFSSQELQSFKVSVRNEKGEVVVESEPFLSPDAPHDSRLIQEYVDRCKIKSLLTVPLKVRNKILGVIHFVNSDQHHYFTPEEISFINPLAAEVSLAIESTSLQEERKVRTEELERFRQEVQSSFSRIGHAITSALDLDSLLYLVSDLSMRVVKAEGCTVYFLAQESLEEKLHIGNVPRFEAGENFFLFSETTHVQTRMAADHSETWTMIHVPLKTQEEKIGFLVLYMKGSREFSNEELDVLSAFAAQAALSVKTIRLFKAEQVKAREMSVVYEAAQAISAPLDLPEILSETAQKMCSLAEVDRCFVFLSDRERRVLSAAFVHGVTPDQKDFFSALAIPLDFLEGVLRERFRQGRSILLKNEDLNQEASSLKNLFSLFNTKNCLLLPLLSERRLTGLLYLDEADRAHDFTDAQIRSVSALSIHAATVIERAQLYKQAEDQNRQVQTLYQISTALSTSLNLDRVVNLIIEKSTHLVNVERFCLFMWDNALNAFTVAAAHGLSEEFMGKAIVKIEDRFVGLASYRKKPIYSANVLLEIDSPQLARIFKKEGLGAVLAVPLVTKRKTIGVITYFADLGYQFKEKEVQLLASFAGHAALSIENSRLYNQNKQKVQELGILFDVGKRINEHLNPQEVLRSMAEQFISVMKSDGCSIMLLDKDEKMLSIQVTRGTARRTEVHKKIKIGEGLVGKVAKTGRPLVAVDQGKDTGQHAFPKGLRDEGISTILSVPLSTKEEILGVVNFYTKERRQYTPSEMHIMETLAAQGAVALRNARIFEENYHIAQLLHRSLLPSHVPNIRDLEFGFQYLPSQEISGDYYDFLELRGKLGIAIADVSGKGTSAALFTAQGKYAWKAYGVLESDPKKVLRLLNRLMFENTPSEKFMSMFYGVLDLKRKEFTFSNAGHLPPIFYRAAGKRCRNLDAPGLLLGIDQDVDFVKRSVNLHSGDVLLFYTDGVTEARNESREMFGLERLEKVLVDNAHLPAQVIANRILSTVRQFALRRTLEDDITVVVLKMK